MVIRQKDKDYDHHLIAIFPESKGEEKQVMIKPLEFGPSHYMSLEAFKEKYDGYSACILIDYRSGEAEFVSSFL